MHEVVFPHSARRDRARRHGVRRRRRTRSPTPSSRSGAPTTTASIPRARGAFRRDDHTFTGFGRAATTDDGHYEFWTRNPGPVDGEAPFFAVDRVRARACPTSSTPASTFPSDEDAARRRPAAVLARRRRARYAHRDAHARRRTPPRHPAAGREGDRVPCLLTDPSESRRRRRSAVAGDASASTTSVTDAAVARRARHRRGRARPRALARRRASRSSRRVARRDRAGFGWTRAASRAAATAIDAPALAAAMPSPAAIP